MVVKHKIVVNFIFVLHKFHSYKHFLGVDFKNKKFQTWKVNFYLVLIHYITSKQGEMFTAFFPTKIGFVRFAICQYQVEWIADLDKLTLHQASASLTKIASSSYSNIKNYQIVRVQVFQIVKLNKLLKFEFFKYWNSQICQIVQVCQV